MAQGKVRELADVMQRSKLDVCNVCVQETRCKGSKARSTGTGCDDVCNQWFAPMTRGGEGNRGNEKGMDRLGVV